jgi:predicted phosphodiesterase
LKIENLGVLNASLALFGGPYSNAQATRAFFGAIGRHGVSRGNVICTGDVVAYCGDPRRAIDLIRASGCTVVAGNCEKQLSVGAFNCGCGFETGTACDILSNGWFSFANSQISAADRDWMGTCPDIAVFMHQGQRCAVIHGGVTDISRFVWSNSPEEMFAREIADLTRILGPIDTVICGHSGLPFIRQISEVTWVNAGAIGMPPHDGRQMTRYAILDGGEVTFHALQYDVPGAVADMQRAGLTQGYDRALQTGYWPSEDVLPPDLRAFSLAKG